jgi:hypothetical protein
MGSSMVSEVSDMVSDTLDCECVRSVRHGVRHRRIMVSPSPYRGQDIHIVSDTPRGEGVATPPGRSSYHRARDRSAHVIISASRKRSFERACASWTSDTTPHDATRRRNGGARG